MKLSTAEHKKRKEATIKYFDVKRDPVTQKVLNPEAVSVTSQSHKDACDINLIMKRIESGNFDPRTNIREGRFGDFTNVPTFQESLKIVSDVKAEFAALPGEVRARFENDPAQLLAFMEDPANENEAVRLKLMAAPRFEDKKIETPEGIFWVKLKNGKEVSRAKYENVGDAKPPAAK